MTKEELLEKLRSFNTGDSEVDHINADDALLEFINDPEVTVAFEAIEKWWA
jgi:hypothetical protein